MTLVDFYKEKNLDSVWYDKYSKLGKEYDGKFFAYMNTNYRRLSSFIEQFRKFLPILGKNRSEWSKVDTHGQEKDKQRVVNLITSKLFFRDENNVVYLTEKGKTFQEFLELDFTDREKFCLIYLFLLNSFFDNTKNYILDRATYLHDLMLSNDGLKVEMLDNFLYEVISLDKTDFKNIVKTNFFYIHSFYSDPEFIIKFLRSSNYEKEELSKYIVQNKYKGDKTGEYLCCISKKYENAGNYNPGTFLDDTTVFYFTIKLIDVLYNTKINPIGFILELSSDIFGDQFNNNKVKDFIGAHTDVFNIIFADLVESEEEFYSESDYKVPFSEEKMIDIEDKKQQYIDETTPDGKTKIKHVFNILKNQAKNIQHYKCALEELEDKCRYFTSKSTNNNYLELHHFIPREFRNNFPYSIEVLANYIALCPHCHRKIHSAIDRERMPLINYLFNNRKERLNMVGLEIDLSDIKGFYKVND